jgi:hypothetical protein
MTRDRRTTGLGHDPRDQQLVGAKQRDSKDFSPRGNIPAMLVVMPVDSRQNVSAVVVCSESFSP